MVRLRLVLLLLAWVLPLAGAHAQGPRYIHLATSPDHARQLGAQEASERFPRSLGPIQTGVAFVSSAALGPIGFGGNYFLQVQGTKRVVYRGGDEDGLTEGQRRIYREYIAGYSDTSRRNRLSRARKSALVGGVAGLAVFFTAATLVSAAAD